ncbi:MAG: hypothetical protein KME28_26065 [Pelatocladus maniniholoensis HA4357-MV3]|jgi:hypothetical protein|uniref:Uncharacterized protein n=1 Tax=Pelatocladus maniniholoensis HA4357-MV3 TaxID=1117104 RepID=A0A9E3HEJ4_9NOST|nr:hypothetical protein [Pelatocladus maniniholoensis HA4357-MV3]
MNLIIKQYKGLGAIKLGITREVLRQIIIGCSGELKSFMKKPTSEILTDSFNNLGIENQQESERSKNFVDNLKLAKKLINNNLKQQEAKKTHESERISKTNSQNLEGLSPKLKEAHHVQKDMDVGRNRQLAQQIGEPSSTHAAKSSEIKSQSREISHPDKNQSEKGEASSTRSPKQQELGKNVNESKNQRLAHQMKDSSVNRPQKYTEVKSVPKENSTNSRRDI